MSRRGWAACAIATGVWETLAVTSRRLPTLSVLVWRARRRWPRATALAVAGSVGSLARHLLRRDN